MCGAITSERNPKMPSTPTLVSVHWVANQINSNAKNFRIIDASWDLPVAKRDLRGEYRKAHIPSALFFDIEQCPSSGVANTLPSPDEFAQYVGRLGIGNDTHVVVYENNAKFGVFSAPRTWWLFRVFGHSKVSMMEGGLPLWTKEGHKTTDVIPEVDQVQYRASYTPNLLKSFSDVEANLEMEAFQVMDARPMGQFTGDMPDPREGTA